MSFYLGSDKLKVNLDNKRRKVRLTNDKHKQLGGILYSSDDLILLDSNDLQLTYLLPKEKVILNGILYTVDDLLLVDNNGLTLTYLTQKEKSILNTILFTSDNLIIKDKNNLQITVKGGN